MTDILKFPVNYLRNSKGGNRAPNILCQCLPSYKNCLLFLTVFSDQRRASVRVCLRGSTGDRTANPAGQSCFQAHEDSASSKYLGLCWWIRGKYSYWCVYFRHKPLELNNKQLREMITLSHLLKHSIFFHVPPSAFFCMRFSDWAELINAYISSFSMVPTFTFMKNIPVLKFISLGNNLVKQIYL